MSGNNFRRKAIRMARSYTYKGNLRSLKLKAKMKQGDQAKFGNRKSIMQSQRRYTKNQKVENYGKEKRRNIQHKILFKIVFYI